MKRAYLLGPLVAATFAVSLAAQSQTPSKPTQSKKPASPPPLTLTGCLTPTATGAAGTTAGSYMLNDVTGGAPKGPKTYTLLGGDHNAFIKFGHSRVEVVGSMDPQPAAWATGGSGIGRGPIGAAKPPLAHSTGAAGTSATPPTFHVTSVRQVPGSCGGK